MNKLTRFWQALELLPSLAAVSVEWKSLLQSEFDVIEPFLRARKDRAISYPKADGGLPYQIVEHSEGDMVGVCPETGDTISLQKSQLVVYELDRKRLASSLASAYGIGHKDCAEEWMGHAVPVGEYKSHSSACYPVLLTFPRDPDDCFLIATRLIAERRAPLVLLAPTRRCLRLDAEMSLRLNSCVFVALIDNVKASGRGRFEIAEPLGAIILRETDSISRPQPWLSLAEAAQISCIDRGVISRAIDAGELRSNGEKGKGKRKVDAADLSFWQLKRSKRSGQTESNEQVERLVKKHVTK